MMLKFTILHWTAVTISFMFGVGISWFLINYGKKLKRYLTNFRDVIIGRAIFGDEEE